MKVRHKKESTAVIRRVLQLLSNKSLYPRVRSRSKVDNICNFSRSLAPTVLSDFRISSGTWTDPARRRKIFTAQYRHYYSPSLILMHFSRSMYPYLLAPYKPTHSERFMYTGHSEEWKCTERISQVFPKATFIYLRFML